MVRLYLFAEGQTEQTFADTVLKPHLAKVGVFLHGPVLIAHARKKGKIYRGGGRKYLTIKNDIIRFLKQESGRDVFFTSMIDLYGLPSGFPGMQDAEGLRYDPHKRVEALEYSWSEDIGDQRFIPFIQLHEYEAYLFCDVTQLALFYFDKNAEIHRLKEIAESVGTPELIDDGPHTAPSKRIIEALPEYGPDKRTVGPQAAELIGLNHIRSKCPHFDGWLVRLEGLSGANSSPKKS
ncbi:MAG: DUF4276 family protein [Blastocatellia bacterium]